MQVTNIMQEKINLTLNKKLSKKLAELYADKNARETALRTELEAIRDEANAKAKEIIAKYPDAHFSMWGSVNVPFVQTVASVKFNKDDELERQAQELKNKKKELAMDMEIRCTLEKNADNFFKMLAEVNF